MTDHTLTAALDEHPPVTEPHLREMARRIAQERTESDRWTRIERAAYQFVRYGHMPERAVELGRDLVNALDNMRAQEER